MSAGSFAFRSNKRLLKLRTWSWLIFFFPILVSAEISGSKVDDWVEAGYGNPRFFDTLLYPVGNETVYTHGIELDILLVRGSGWTKAILEERYRKVAAVFNQCGLKIIFARVIEIDSPGGVEEFDYGYKVRASTANFSERIPTGTSRLTMIHVRKLRNSVLGYAGSGWNSSGTLRINKQWISYAALSSKHLPEYSVEAHELGHTLMNCRHVNFRNLMASSPEDGNGTLTQEQRKLVLKHPLVYKLR